EAQELYLALLKERCQRDGLDTSDEVLAKQFRLHLHRGIGYLAAPHAIRSLADLVRLTLDANQGRELADPTPPPRLLPETQRGGKKGESVALLPSGLWEGPPLLA